MRGWEVQDVLFIRVPYYIGDLERDPSSENYPFTEMSFSGLGVEFRIMSAR